MSHFHVSLLTFPIYFDTVHLIEWRNTILINPTISTFLIEGNSSLSALFKLPVTLFTTLYTSRYLSLFQQLSTFPTELLFLLFSLVSFLLAYTIHRSYRIQYTREHELLVSDILTHEVFLKLKEYQHHVDHIYDHVKRVSYLSYRISKALGLDYHAAARGGLLHDFFLYDWRERKSQDTKRSAHGKEHPFIALNNAQKYFSVNKMETDIIDKHMFPKTLSLPRYRESFIVSLSDKLAAAYEYALGFKRS
ncbi:MAG: HD domain-containing protein [Sphaerochaetaceae bacterium]